MIHTPIDLLSLDFADIWFHQGRAWVVLAVDSAQELPPMVPRGTRVAIGSWMCPPRGATWLPQASMIARVNAQLGTNRSRLMSINAFRSTNVPRFAHEDGLAVCPVTNPQILG